MAEQISIKEIEELVKIPEIEKFLLKAMEQAKEKFQDQIRQHQDLVVPTFKNGKSKDKSYFFALNRIQDPDSKIGHKWELEEFKLKSQPQQEIVDEILSQFIKKVDFYEVLPQQMQNQNFSSPILKKSFNITFMKNKENRVNGYVEEISEDKQDKEEFVLKDKGGMVKISVEDPGFYKEEMHKKIIQLMEEDEVVRDDIIFYYLMVQKSRSK
jgi:hypothetical protein